MGSQCASRGLAAPRSFSGQVAGDNADQGAGEKSWFSSWKPSLPFAIPSQQVEADYVSPVNGAPRLPSPWNKWFPYEPVPCSPQLHPYKVECKAGQDYWWCSCGECRTQPWCEDDGGPNGCRSRGFAPVMYVPQHDGTKLMCGCKQCGSAPLFNGTCWVKWTDYNIGKAVGLSFVASFFFGILSTWMAHP
jgi:hypothetical protein